VSGLLGVGLVNEIERMGGSDVWLLMRPDALGVTYKRQGRHVRHSIALPFGKPSDTAFAVLLDMADQDLSESTSR
jgi:hypothetical protein